MKWPSPPERDLVRARAPRARANSANDALRWHSLADTSRPQAPLSSENRRLRTSAWVSVCMYEEMARSSGLRTRWMHSQPPPGAHGRRSSTVDGGLRPGCLSKTSCVYERGYPP
eukprot:scaffold36353_cov64-Phaeocystis_antarctica.AAC.5